MEHRSPAYVAVLAVIAGSILMVGSLMRPEKRVEQDTAPPSQVDMARLQRLTQLGSLEQMSDFFTDLASGVSPYLLRLDALGQSGLVWDAEGRVVTANRPGTEPVLGPTPARTSVSGLVELNISFDPPHLPLSVLRAGSDAGLASPVHVPKRLLEPGAWVMAAWRSAAGEIARVPGFFLGSRTRPCQEADVDHVVLSFEVTDEMAGGGLFDLYGRLVAAIVNCDGYSAAIAVDSVDELLSRAGTFEGQMLGRYGLKVAPLTEPQQRHFAVENAVLVSELWGGYLGDRAGLEPGDLIVSVDSAAVKSLEDARKLVLPIARELHELEVRRGRRTVGVKLPARSVKTAPEALADHSGALLARSTQGFPIGTVIEGSAAAQAGIKAGDRLLRVDQTRIRTEAQARRALANGSGKPRYLVLARGSKRWGTLLP